VEFEGAGGTPPSSFFSLKTPFPLFLWMAEGRGRARRGVFPPSSFFFPDAPFLYCEGCGRIGPAQSFSSPLFLLRWQYFPSFTIRRIKQTRVEGIQTEAEVSLFLSFFGLSPFRSLGVVRERIVSFYPPFPFPPLW